MLAPTDDEKAIAVHQGTDYLTNGDGLPDELACLKLLKAFWDHVYAALRDGHQGTMLWVDSDDFLVWCGRGVMVDPEEVRPRLRKTYEAGRARRKAQLAALMDGQAGMPLVDDSELDALLNDLPLDAFDDGLDDEYSEVSEIRETYGLEWRYAPLEVN